MDKLTVGLGVKAAADVFVQWAKNTLREHVKCDVEVQTALPGIRTWKKKTMPVAQDRPVLNVNRNYKFTLLNHNLSPHQYSLSLCS